MNSDKKLIYSNFINVGMTEFDMVLDVNYRNGQYAEELCQIAMSPQHFKALVRAMNQTLLQYEALFGPLTNEINNEVLSKMQQSGQVNVEEFNHVGRG